MLIKASDGSLKDKQLLTIYVINVNDAPVITNLPSAVNVSEDAVAMGTVDAIFTVLATDRDLDNVTFTFVTHPSGMPVYVNESGMVSFPIYTLEDV